MIVEIHKIVQFKAFIEIKPTEKGFLLSIQDESGGKVIHVTHDELELISKSILKELGK